jgi:two-component system LytT family sensor kinase
VFRHIVFWIVWIIYFIVINSMRMGSSYIGFNSFLQYITVEMLIMLSVDIVFCYAVIYLLVPKFLLKEKYILFFLFIGLFMLLDASVSSYFYTWIINPIRKLYDLPELKYIAITDLLRGLNGVLMITGVACTIKFFKMWNIKKQELYLVKSEKISRELKFIDTYIQPSFLPVLLKKIYSYSFSAANKVPEMLEKLQNILSYLIDECNQSTVMLEHEIESIKDFIQLEKLTNTDRLNITYNQTGDADNLRIVPFILFPFVENNFRQINDNITDKHWTNLDIIIEGSKITLLLKNSKPVETSNLLSYETVTLQQMRKRLDLLYPASYKMNIIIEENTFSIKLEIDLSKAVN